MSIRIECPSCHKAVKAGDKYAGQTVKCPGCGEPLRIPEADIILTEAETAIPPPSTPPPQPEAGAIDDDASKLKRATLWDFAEMRKYIRDYDAAFTLLAIAVVFILICLYYGDWGDHSEPAGAGGDASTPPAAPRDIRVTSQIVKLVGGKHRYFFDIRNHDSKPFEGDVTITLLNNQPGVTNGEDTFSTKRPIAPKLGTFVYMDINTGPVAVHGEWGVARFRFEATSGGGVVASGEGQITQEYENLSQ